MTGQLCCYSLCKNQRRRIHASNLLCATKLLIAAVQKDHLTNLRLGLDHLERLANQKHPGSDSQSRSLFRFPSQFQFRSPSASPSRFLSLAAAVLYLRQRQKSAIETARRQLPAKLRQQ